MHIFRGFPHVHCIEIISTKLYDMKNRINFARCVIFAIITEIEFLRDFISDILCEVRNDLKCKDRGFYREVRHMLATQKNAHNFTVKIRFNRSMTH